jgi:hypothetical protein
MRHRSAPATNASLSLHALLYLLIPANQPLTTHQMDLILTWILVVFLFFVFIALVVAFWFSIQHKIEDSYSGYYRSENEVDNTNSFSGDTSLV